MSFLVVLLGSLLVFPILIESACYPTGARCVPDKAFQTTVKWHSCQEYCNKCQGYAMGDCEKMFTKLCYGKWQCRCSGSRVPKSSLILDQATCQMGV